MKKMDLNDFSVEAMSKQEMRTTNGGWLLAAITITGACIYVYNNADDFIAGFKEGWNNN